MGNTIHFQQHKVKPKALAAEIKKKICEQNILFIGEPKCGKTEMIQRLVNIYNDQNNVNQEIKDKECFKEYKYNLNEEFVVREYTHSSLVSKHGYSSYTYLNLIHQIAKPKELCFMQKKEIQKIVKSMATMGDYQNKQDPERNNIINYELLVKGYIKYNLPVDIINLLVLFCAKPIITSYKIKYFYVNEFLNPEMAIYATPHLMESEEELNDYFNNAYIEQNIYNFWDIQGCKYHNYNYSDYSKLLCDFIHVLIFVIDISQYDEFDADGSNKLVNAFSAFRLFYNVNNCLDERWANPNPHLLPQHTVPPFCDKISKKIVFNKMIRFKHKLLADKIAINKCPIFSDCEFVRAHYGDDYKYTAAILTYMENKLESQLIRNRKTKIYWFTSQYRLSDIKKVFDIILPGQRTRFAECNMHANFHCLTKFLDLDKIRHGL